MQNALNFRHILIWFALILCPGVGYGQQYASIYLDNGDRITGRWLGADEQSAHIEINNQRLSVPLGEIKNIVPVGDLRLIPNATAEKYFSNGVDLLELGLREEAKKRFQAAIEEFPKYAEAHYQLGRLLQEEGNNDDALRYFGYVAAIDPEAHDMAPQFKQAGDAYLATEEYRKAVDGYLLLFNNYPDYPDSELTAYTAGFLLAEELDAVEEGLRTLQEARTRFPDSPYLEKAEYLIGLLQSKAGQAEPAVRTLTDFILKYPESDWVPAAHLARGDANLQLRLNKDAIADFQFAYEHTSDLKMKREARKKRDESAWTIYKVSDGLPSNQIEAVAVDGDMVWIGTPKGLAQIDVSMESWQPMTNVPNFINTEIDEKNPINVRALAVDEQELWIGTLNHGVIRYHKPTAHAETYDTRSGLPHNTVYDIKIDKDEVWVGTFSGVAQYHRSTGQWKMYDKENDHLPADDITTLAVTPKEIWIGTSASGMAVYDRGIGYWRDFDLDLRPGGAIVSFDVGQNQVFFTWYDKRNTSSGYGAIQPDTLTHQVQEVIRGNIVPPENIYVTVSKAMDEIEESPLMWLATNEGVYIKYAHGWGQDPIGFPEQRFSTPIVSCISLGDGVAWIGTSEGLAKIDTSALVAQGE